MIVLPNIDSKIWNIDIKTIDIMREIQKKNRVDISLNEEGPCAESLGLYHLLDRICNVLKCQKNNVTIFTCNQLESHSEYHVKIKPPLYIAITQHFGRSISQCVEKSFDMDFKHFGVFVGRSNWVRLWLCSQIWNKHKERCIMTYHWRPGNEYHAAHIGIDDMLVWNASTTEAMKASEFLDKCPLDLDETNAYPILSPRHLDICKLYHRFFVEIVFETYYSGVSFYPTEKIWRPLLMKTPFIVHGSVDYLSNLRRLGFKTFDAWWSEEYDSYGHDNRVRRILGILDRLNRLSLADRKSMHRDMLPVLEHNHQVFMQLKESDFPKVFNYV